MRSLRPTIAQVARPLISRDTWAFLKLLVKPTTPPPVIDRTERAQKPPGLRIIHISLNTIWKTGSTVSNHRSLLCYMPCKLRYCPGRWKCLKVGGASSGRGHGERVEREPITGVWGRSPQRGPVAEPLVALDCHRFQWPWMTLNA